MKLFTLLLIMVWGSSSAQHGKDSIELYRTLISDDRTEIEANEMLERLVLGGNPEAQSALARRLYYQPSSLPSDPDRAFELWGLSCNGGFWRACFMHSKRLWQLNQYQEAESLLLKTLQDQKDWLSASVLWRLYLDKEWSGFSKEKSEKYKNIAEVLRNSGVLLSR